MSQPAASAAFSAHADEYDATRRRLIPGYDAFCGAVVEVLGHVGVRRVLDLGAGTGLLSAAILDALPDRRTGHGSSPPPHPRAWLSIGSEASKTWQLAVVVGFA